MTPTSQDKRVGLAAAVTVYAIWGMFPLFFSLLDGVAPTEVLAHRVVWSLGVVALILTAVRAWPDVPLAWGNRRARKMLFLSAVVLSINWLGFIAAVLSGQVLQASLGYYINPLVSILLGVVFLGERLTRRQWAAVALAAVGVLVLTVQSGAVPWLALIVGFTFGVYGLLRKTVPATGVAGLFVETVVLMPVAVGYLVWLAFIGDGTFGAQMAGPRGWPMEGYLIACGFVTAVPLLLFAAAAKRLTLSTMGFIQYMTPTLHFVIAVWVMGEPFGPLHLVGFALIWTALALYSIEAGLIHRRR